jgi:hypothetical protein
MISEDVCLANNYYVLVLSRKYRVELQEVRVLSQHWHSTDFGGKMTELLPLHAQPKVRQALSSDERGIASLLQEILSSDNGKEGVLRCSYSKINVFMTLLREVRNYLPPIYLDSYLDSYTIYDSIWISRGVMITILLTFTERGDYLSSIGNL